MKTNTASGNMVKHNALKEIYAVADTELDCKGEDYGNAFFLLQCLHHIRLASGVALCEPLRNCDVYSYATAKTKWQKLGGPKGAGEFGKCLYRKYEAEKSEA